MQSHIVERLFRDLPFYAEHILRIKPKTGAIVPLKLNRAQLYLHEQAEQQKKEIGKVRIVVIKGRQQGISTYVGARFFWHTALKKSISTFIFAHDADGSDTLFSMVKNFYEHSPVDFRPEISASNAKELRFQKMNSGYRVGTAGTKGMGRGKTLQRLHWSEVAYSPNPEEHSAGILQTVADLPDTEEFLESTSAGQGDYFHRFCMEALSGKGDWKLVFLPWYWQDEYKREYKGEKLDDKELEYLELYEKDGLTKEHLIWRRFKIQDFDGDVYRFQREYPFNIEEAFSVNDEDSYIKAEPVIQARNTEQIPTNAPLVIGVDPARLGNNRIVMCHRTGRNTTKLLRLKPMNTTDLAYRLAEEIRQYNPFKMFIDVGGLGVGVYDNLVSMGFGSIVEAINFGEAAVDKDRYANRRAEMYGEANKYLLDKPVSIQVEKTAGDALQAELCSVKSIPERLQRLLLKSKDDMKKEGFPSPDFADAFVLTFAKPVSKTNIQTKVVRPNMNWNALG